MQQRANGCKGCRESVQITPDKLQRLVDIATRGRAAATDELYAQRMAHCGRCPDLQYGTTCRYCGCLVAVKARLLDSVCPCPLFPKW
ncbi:DUF6171 family protein [Paenibacillus ehimensis]|uniref:DUF6171 family protein n=1 Tax=Paenibacillus ehimensis TaxID=79264 RepID=UPI000FD7DCBD|nr:DUF6171 family protein [Paenibacillus ehimensis]